MKNLWFLCAFLVFSCTKNEENPAPANESELITTVRLNFKDVGTNSVSTYSYRDLDGTGGGAPSIDNIVLTANKTYQLTVEVLDESKAGTINDIAKEIENEADEHQFFYTGSAITNGLCSFVYEDLDKKGLPLGLKMKAQTLKTGAGDLVVTLRHKPTKTAQGSLATAGGSTDIEVKFNFAVR